MIYGHGDIDDDQIRIISSRETERKKKRRRKRFVFLWCIAVAFLIGALVLMFFIPEETVEEKTMWNFLSSRRSKKKHRLLR